MTKSGVVLSVRRRCVRPKKLEFDTFKKEFVSEDDELDGFQLREFRGEQKPLKFMTVTDTVDTVGRPLKADGWDVIGRGNCIIDNPHSKFYISTGGYYYYYYGN